MLKSIFSILPLYMSLQKKSRTSAYTQILRLQIVALLVFSFFVSITLALETYNSKRALIWTGWSAHNWGQFYFDDGNPGSIDFWAVPTDAWYSGGHLMIPLTWPQVLTWSFWIETIGWVNMHDIWFSLTDTGAGIWSLSGYAWSDQAGWTDFSRVTYQLSNTSFSGYAWNDMIGWINMAWASLDMTSSGAIGKVKILWSYGGNRIFNTIYTLDGKIAPATVTRIINDVRKNVALLTRNVPDNKINTEIDSSRIFAHSTSAGVPNSLDNKLFFINESASIARVDYTRSVRSRFENIGNTTTPIHSVIVIGADVYIDDSVAPQNDGKPRAIIALKNDAWVGGNIIIQGWVTRIKSTLIAEWSLYSWEYSGANPQYYNSDPASLFRIPNRQLYVHGSIISNNTIGWYEVDNGIENTCPYNITPCDDSRALLYDLNHFRDFQKDLPEKQIAVIRWYPNNLYDDYSLVIEHDARILDNPPPGLENID